MKNKMGWKLDKVLMFSKGSMNTREEGVYEERNKGCVEFSRRHSWKI